MLKRIIAELRAHAPMTLSGALLGMVFVGFSRSMAHETAHNLFYIAHPLHVLLSAVATAAMYQRYQCAADNKRCNLWLILLIGYVGSIGVATVSDSFIPFWGERLLGLPHADIHAGFVEKPLLINSMALTGIIIAYLNPTTKFPHFLHVLVSTWASLFHILMAQGQDISVLVYAGLMVFLFMSVWLPCCFSDIVFPLLFVKDKNQHFDHHH